MNSSRGLKATFVALLALALLPALAAAAPKFDQEFPVPGIETPDKIVEGQDGNMWVALSGANAGENDVARITPAGAVKEFALTQGATALTEASGIARDAEGNLWVTGEAAVAKFKPQGGEVIGTAIESLAQVTGAQHGTASIVLGPDGRMWIAAAGNAIAFKPTDTNLELNKELIPIGGLNPHDIDVAGRLLAIADQTRIVTLNKDGTPAKEYTLGGASQGVAGTSADLFAYSEPGNPVQQQVGLISPPNALPSIVTPNGLGDPFGVAVGSDGAFWFVLGGTGFGELARLAPGKTTLERVPGMLKDGLERQIAAGPNKTLWVTVSKADSEGVARFSGIEQPTGGPHIDPPVKHEPETNLVRPIPGTVVSRGRKAKVVFRFTSPDPGAAFDCRVFRRGARKPAFARCRSPKAYRLKPGRYTFEVRAVVTLMDTTPAKRNFRVVRAVASKPMPAVH
jgi:streptogramin lyase